MLAHRPLPDRVPSTPGVKKSMGTHRVIADRWERAGRGARPCRSRGTGPITRGSQSAAPAQCPTRRSRRTGRTTRGSLPTRPARRPGTSVARDPPHHPRIVGNAAGAVPVHVSPGGPAAPSAHRGERGWCSARAPRSRGTCRTTRGSLHTRPAQRPDTSGRGGPASPPAGRWERGWCSAREPRSRGTHPATRGLLTIPV